MAAIFATPSGAFAQGAGLGAAGELVDPDVLRVSADPSDMPFSEGGKGFENKFNCSTWREGDRAFDYKYRRLAEMRHRHFAIKQ